MSDDVVNRTREVVDCTEEHIDDGTDWIEAADQVIRDLIAEVEALRAERVRLCKLVAELWSNANDWHGGRASSHYRSDLMDRGVRAALEETDQ